MKKILINGNIVKLKGQPQFTETLLNYSLSEHFGNCISCKYQEKNGSEVILTFCRDYSAFLGNRTIYPNTSFIFCFDVNLLFGSLNHHFDKSTFNLETNPMDTVNPVDPTWNPNKFTDSDTVKELIKKQARVLKLSRIKDVDIKEGDGYITFTITL